MIYVSRFFFLSLSVSPVKRIIKLDSLCVDYLLFPFTKIRIRVYTINSHSLLSKSLLELDFDLSNNTTIQLNLIPPIYNNILKKKITLSITSWKRKTILSSP